MNILGHMGQHETYSIRQMVELTGLSEFTIRGWENRYSAFSPRRDDSGRREYLKSDIERALLLRELLKRGHKIGQVAALKDKRLKELFEETDGRHQDQIIENKSALATEALELIALQRWTELEFFIKKVQFKDVNQLINKFLRPLLQALSANVNAGLVSISQEHITSSLIKEKIYSILSEVEKKKNKSPIKGNIRFVLATPEGDYHEIGLLLAHLLIRSYGICSLYLGPHTPSRDLAETALRFNASHLLIVATVSKKSGAKQEPLSYVSQIQSKVGTHLQIFLAGAQTPITQETKPSLTILGVFQDLERYLANLEANNA